MKVPTFTPGGEHKEDSLNPSNNKYKRQFDAANFEERLANTPSQDEVEKGLDDLERYANNPTEATNNTVSNQESNTQSWRYNISEKNPVQQTPIKAKGSSFKKKGKWFALGGGLGIGGLIVGAIFALLPFKLTMFLDNITEMASSVPGYAMERRTEYIATKLLATHLIRKASDIPGTDSDVLAKTVFCKNASISCSLIHTYGADYFEKIIDINVKKRFGDNVLIELTPKGRDTLGGKARSWELTINRSLGDDQLLKTTKTLVDNASAKVYIKNLVNKNLKSKSVITRYLARSILMKKYGITHWRGFEKTSNKIAETKIKIKTSVMKNTVGRVSSGMSLRLGCFSSQALCDSLTSGISSTSNELQDKIDELKKDPEKNKKDIDRLESKKAALDKLVNSKMNDADLAGNEGAKKLLMKKILSVAGGAAAIVGLVDLVFSAVGAIDDGRVDLIAADITRTAYAGFTFGEDTGAAVNADKLKAGEMDLETYGALLEMFDGAEQSPLMQFENGLLSADDIHSKSYTRTCDIGGEQKATMLPKGQIVCPERQIVHNYASIMKTNPALQTLAGAAYIWNSSIGSFISTISDVLGELPGIKQVGELISATFAPMIEWAMSLFLTPPALGKEVGGAENYDALSGGVRDIQNELMAQGVSDTGTAFGGAGEVLSSGQTSAILREVEKDNQDNLEQHSMIARIFDVNLRGSFSQKFVAQLPTSLYGYTQLSTRSLGSLFSRLLTPTTVGAASDQSVNPFNLPIYGYRVDDPALTADPADYTEASCANSAKIREDSYQQIPSISVLKVYTKTDPCALEKMVVGSMLTAQGVTNDPYALQKPGSTPVSQPGTQTPSINKPTNAGDWGDGWSLLNNEDYSKIPCDPRTIDAGIVTTVQSNSKIRLCEMPAKYHSFDSSNGSNSVSSLIAGNLINMFEAAKTDADINLAVADGMRINFSGGYRSEHTRGVAVDIRVVGHNTICYGGDPVNGYGSKENAMAQCKAIGGEMFKAYQWLNANAARFGFLNYVKEPWHWSTSGR